MSRLFADPPACLQCRSLYYTYRICNTPVCRILPVGFGDLQQFLPHPCGIEELIRFPRRCDALLLCSSNP